jgi:hypothetical protein
MVTNVTSPVAAKRKEPVSPLRRTSEIVLITGTVVAAIAAFGPTWAVRLGIVVAIIAAVVACLFAWRELFSARRQHARAMIAASRDHGRALTDERSRNAAVVDTLRGRVADAGVLIEKQRVTIAELKMRISGLKGDKAYLRAEVDHRESVISALRVTVRAREAELIALRDEPDAEVHTMPRRVFTEPDSTDDATPTAEDLWTDGSHPTVVDLKTLELAMVLPNYEVDRRVG